MDIGGRVASGTAAEKTSGSAKPTRRGAYFRNTDAYTDVGSRKRMEQVFEKTEGISKNKSVPFILDN